MAEYIDKAELVKSFEETIQSAEIWRDDCKDLGVTAEFAERAIIDFNEARLRVQNFATVDAVEVVRCKDCKYWMRTVGDEQWSLGDCNSFDMHLVMCNGFCAWAERREDGRS